MTQHFTRSTQSASFHCNKCGKMTQHRIDDRRKGPCLECMAKLEDRHQLTGLVPAWADLKQIEQFLERAAIKEYDGKQPKEQAEKEAAKEIFGPTEQEKMF